jgi:tryptophan synthase alpha chain
MSRLAATFARLRETGQPGLVTYVTAGDPDLERTSGVLRALDRAGADVLEIGVPFSDPLADGPVIQRATERALASGTTLGGVLDTVADARGRVQAPLVIFSYANPILRMGPERFADRALEAGVDGVLVLDLPIEEADGFRNMLHTRGIDTILLLSPTTTDERLRKAASLGSGFLYAISRLGVTGARDHLADGAREMVGRIRRVTDLPVALGFGISTPEHVREVGRWAASSVSSSNERKSRPGSVRRSSIPTAATKPARLPGSAPQAHCTFMPVMYTSRSSTTTSPSDEGRWARSW